MPSQDASTGCDDQMSTAAASSHAMGSVEPLLAAIPTSKAAVWGSVRAGKGGEARSDLLQRLSRRANVPDSAA